VQHLVISVPWHSFLQETVGGAGDSQEQRKQILSESVVPIVDSTQLLRRSARDARHDARQRAASSGEADPAAEVGGIQRDRDSGA